MILLPRSFRTTALVALFVVALLPVSCGPKQSQEQSEPTASTEQAAQPQTNGLPPDQFLTEFGAMGYMIDAPWMDGGGNVWLASAHKPYENNQMNFVMGSNTQSRVDQISLTAIVADGAMSPQMREAFETGVRTCFAGMELKIPDTVVKAVRNESAFNSEAGRFGVHITRADDPNGGYMLALRMNSQ